jgi:hypothetical protein
MHPTGELLEATYAKGPLHVAHNGTTSLFCMLAIWILAFSFVASEV